MNLKAVRKNLSIISILLGGLTLRLISINQSLWLDEATSAVLVRDFSFPDILTKFSPGDFHPPLYYILLKFWSTIFGTSEIRLRSLSVVVGVGGIYLTYLLARMLFNKKIALVSSLLLATSGLHIYFSQEARMYVLASTFVLLTIFYFVKTIGDGRVGDLVLFSVFLYLSVMTNYITVFIIPVFWIYGYLKRKNKYWFKKLFMSHIILGVFGVLWLPTFLKQLSIGANVRILFPIWWATLGKTNFKDVLLVPVKFMIGRVSWDNKILYGFIVVSLFIFFGLLIYDGYQKHKGNQRYYFVLLWLGVPYLLALVFGLWFSVFSYFRLLYLLPAFYILISLGLSSLSKKIFKLVLVLTLIINLSLAGFYLINPRFHREDWRGLVSYVKMGDKLSKSAVVFVSGSQTEAFRYYDPTGEIKTGGPELIQDGYDIIWLMRYVQPMFDPEDKVRSQLEGLEYMKIGEHNFNGVVVWKYMGI